MKKNPILLVLTAVLLIVTACAPPAIHIMNSGGASTEATASVGGFTQSSTASIPLSTVTGEASQPTELSQPTTLFTTPAGTAETAQPTVTQPRPSETETTIDSSSETTRPLHVHNHLLTASREPECTQDGLNTYTCSCGDRYTQIIKATGHTWGQWETVKEPTVSAEGISQRTCQRCPATETRTIEQLPTEKPPEVLEISDGALQEIEEGFLRLVNAERVWVGVGELTVDAHLDSAATVRAAECVLSFSHIRPDGTQFYTAIDQLEYPFSFVGENICMTSHVGNGSYTEEDRWVGSPEQIEAVSAWMFYLFKNSSGHYSNMINGSYEHCGIGIAYTPDDAAGIPMFYIAHIFGTR